MQLTGVAQINRDSSEAITSRLPLVLGIIAAITFVLLFLLTGSVVLPLKALVLNVLSLTAAFGALVWIFQDGHLGALGTTPTGTLVANMPVLLFCIAFGLSMDYEVFLVSRIREYWLKIREDPGGQRRKRRARPGADRPRRHRRGADHVDLVRRADRRPGGVHADVRASGMTLAVLADATLVRMLLVPAFMHVLGRWNWWAPKPLARLHERIGISESADDERRRRYAIGRDLVADTGSVRSAVETTPRRRAVRASSCARRSSTRPPNCCWRPVTPRRCPSGRWRSGSG